MSEIAGVMEGFVEHSAEQFAANHTLKELLMTRKFVTVFIIKPLRTEWADDSRAPRALEHYLGERKRINEAIRMKRGAEPPDQVIDLKPVTMAGNAKLA